MRGGPPWPPGRSADAGGDIVKGDKSVRRLLPALEQLLADLPDALAIIHEAAGAAQVPPHLDVAGLLGWLAELMAPDDQLPRPLWVSELARRRATDPVARQAFGAVGERWAAEVPGGQRRLSEFRGSRESAGAPGNEPCLVIILEPDSNGGERYRLSSILFRNARDRERQQWDDTCLPLEEIRSRLQGALPSLVKKVDRTSLFVEFVVPRELLNEDFDQWPIPEPHGSFSHQYHLLGVRYPVVLRHLDRMIPSDDRSLWQARWRRLCDCTGPVNGAVRWVNPRSDVTVGSLAASLLRECFHAQVCLALLPERSAGTPITELLGAGVTAGVPAAIWLRQPSAGRGGPKKDENYLALAVGAAGLHGLPRRVLDLRQQAEEARGAATHQGRHLSLLWDDPNRTWEPPPFTEPQPSWNGADE